jgi:threonine/homoserine/homoserine lactone efflux protein
MSQMLAFLGVATLVASEPAFAVLKLAGAAYLAIEALTGTVLIALGVRLAAERN